MEIISLKKAAHYISSDMSVFVHGGAATPNALIQALIEQSNEIENVTLIHLHTHGPAHYARTEYKNKFRIKNLFVGSNIRPFLDFDRVDYIPCFLSEIPRLFEQKKLIVDVALINVSLPDRNGYCSLGTSVDIVKSALASASVVIAQVNPKVPRTFGDALIHSSEIHYGVDVDAPLAESLPKTLTDIELKIGKHAAELIDDGSTLQIGIGSIPDAVLSSLKSHKNLGLHTEMWSDGALELIKSGVINNSKKNSHKGKSVSTFIIGSQKIYDFIHDNPSVLLMTADYVNNPQVIAKNDKAVCINSAIEIDLSGQICADSIGHHVISGVGGQVDFMRGATLSKEGKPIIALPSRTTKGIPRIVSTLKSGAGVVTTRAHVHYVVTEYGAVDLFGKTINERARLLTSIAHPEDRESLDKMFFNDYK